MKRNSNKYNRKSLLLLVHLLVVLRYLWILLSCENGNPEQISSFQNIFHIIYDMIEVQN